MKNSRKLSVVVPVYNEQDSIQALYAAAAENLADLVQKGRIGEYEIWFVNDGSMDASEAIVKKLIESDDRVHLISFRRNLGKAAALQSGFYHANGDIIVTMDADLQDDPNEIARFVEKLDEGYDLVSGWKYNRQDPLEKRIPSKLFNRVTSAISGIRLHDFNCGFKAYRKEVVRSINLYGEMHRYIPVLAYRKGFRIAEITVKHHKRQFGKSKYGFKRYQRGLFDSLTALFLLRYYDRPMYFFGRNGILLTAVGFIICAYLSVLWFLGNQIGNRPLLLLGVLCIILGIQFISIGFIGDMIVDASFKSRYDESHIREII